MVYWNSISPRAVTDVFSAPNLSIVSIKKEIGEPFIRALMVKWFNSFVEFYSVNGTMSALQIADTINLIMEEYPHFKQEDFKLFFNMAKKGMFGQIFGRMDGEVIMQWLEQYRVHRDTVAQNLSIKEQEAFKTLARPTESSSNWITREQYLEIKSKAEKGDKEAIELLKKK